MPTKRGEATRMEGWHPARVELRCALYAHAKLLDGCVEDMLRAPTLWDAEDLKVAQAVIVLARHHLDQARPALRAGDWAKAARDAHLAFVKLDSFRACWASMLSRKAVRSAALSYEGGVARQKRLRDLLRANETRIGAVAKAAWSRFTTLSEVLDAVIDDPSLQDLAEALQPTTLRNALPEIFRGRRGPRRGSSGK